MVLPWSFESTAGWKEGRYCNKSDSEIFKILNKKLMIAAKSTFVIPQNYQHFLPKDPRSLGKPENNIFENKANKGSIG